MTESAGRGAPFRLALLDARMPDMDGFMLTDRIKQDPQLAECTILILSAAGQMEEAARYTERGIARYLIKPLKQSDLLEAILRAVGESSEAERAPLKSERFNAQAGRSLHILLAEDSLVNQKVALRLLELRGHRVTVVNNGREAVAALEKGHFDRLLMDVQMPEMDGFEATAAIRQQEQSTGSHIPIIAMTAHALKGDRERCLAAGMDGYISKPIQSATLYHVVEEVAAMETAGEAIPAPPVVTMGATEGVMDMQAALRRVGGRTDLLKQIVQLFLQESGKMLNGIRQALTQRDLPKLRRLAHSLKGSADCFAAEATVAAAFRLELMGRDGILQTSEVAFAELERTLERLKVALLPHALHEATVKRQD
jgi:CheY-like chemotaxis protein